jgi:hypothetical protein
MDQAKARLKKQLTLKTCKMTKQLFFIRRDSIHSGLLPSDKVNQHTIIHWMPLMTQLWMNINRVNRTGLRGYLFMDSNMAKNQIQ